MKAVSVTGKSGSGKTTVTECLIGEFIKRGLTVGTVKDIHADNFSIDSEGKNTYKHRAAGATTVTAYSANETAVMYTRRLSPDELLSHYKEDIVILEGISLPSIDNIAVSKEDEIPRIAENTVAVSGRFANTGIKELNGIPVINAVTDAGILVDLILRV